MRRCWIFKIILILLFSIAIHTKEQYTNKKVTIESNQIFGNITLSPEAILYITLGSTGGLLALCICLLIISMILLYLCIRNRLLQHSRDSERYGGEEYQTIQPTENISEPINSKSSGKIIIQEVLKNNDQKNQTQHDTVVFSEQIPKKQFPNKENEKDPLLKSSKFSKMDAGLVNKKMGVNETIKKTETSVTNRRDTPVPSKKIINNENKTESPVNKVWKKEKKNEREKQNEEVEDDEEINNIRKKLDFKIDLEKEKRSKKDSEIKILYEEDYEEEQSDTNDQENQENDDLNSTLKGVGISFDELLKIDSSRFSPEVKKIEETKNAVRHKKKDSSAYKISPEIRVSKDLDFSELVEIDNSFENRSSIDSNTSHESTDTSVSSASFTEDQIKNQERKNTLDLLLSKSENNILSKTHKGNVRRPHTTMRKNKRRKRKLTFGETFDRESIVLGDVISAGSFGSVRKALMFHKKEAIHVAVKQIKVLNKKEMDSIKHEINLQKSLKHSNVLGCYGGWLENGKANIVMELCDCDLTKYEKEYQGSKKKIKLIYQISKGMRYLHHNNVIHRDLKPKNILVVEHDGKMTAKICDFGTSKSVSSFNNTMCGTVEYLPPEVVKSATDEEEKNLDPKLFDVYAFGIIIWEIWTRKPAYTELRAEIENPYPLLKKIHSENIRPSLEAVSDMPEELKDIMIGCWEAEPDHRIQNFDTISERLKIAFFPKRRKKRRKKGRRKSTYHSPNKNYSVNIKTLP